VVETLNEYNRRVAELADYLNVSSRHRGHEAEGQEAQQG
jgi:hypothetical protein